VIDGAGDIGMQVRIAVRVAGHQGPQLDPLGGLRPRGEQRPALEVLAVRVATQRAEVVPGVEDVVAELLAADGGAAKLAPVAVLRMELCRDADRSGFVELSCHAAHP
jgi:hypothetical protein